ncbi:hypothetical protein [Caballeronia sp. J97]|uniref:hypothetical protein n=1 Tax=Caballeronia sp. J97 TaxID=2805429 RepID=UPI002AAF0F62|nr:hypothetical protein [Caballeronia sp. J97]
MSNTLPAMATNRTKKIFADGLGRLLVQAMPAIQETVPYFRSRSFRVGHAGDLLRALEHADPDATVSSTAIKAWFDAEAIPRGRNRISLVRLLGHPAELLLDGEDISHLLILHPEATEALSPWGDNARKNELRRRVEEVTAAVYAVLGNLKDLGERLK